MTQWGQRLASESMLPVQNSDQEYLGPGMYLSVSRQVA